MVTDQESVVYTGLKKACDRCHRPFCPGELIKVSGTFVFCNDHVNTECKLEFWLLNKLPELRIHRHMTFCQQTHQQLPLEALEAFLKKVRETWNQKRLKWRRFWFSY
jgi:hypothetical protein